jgi:DNA ligase D-like protein (predicted 3'-phosphoesterase)
MPRFVVQEHHARSHHFDFRLEKEGVFKSWAVPKGLPEEPGTKRLAVQVEDHNLEFGGFEGSIPTGEYGAGTISVWDNGEYELAEWSENRIAFTLSGKRIAGNFVMVRFKGSDTAKWLLIRENL